MTARRSRGEGGLHFDETRGRWIATAAVGFDARGKRITRKASGTTKTAAKTKLREMLRDHADGLTTTGTDTVEDAVRDWLPTGSPDEHHPRSTTPPSRRLGSSARSVAVACRSCPPRTSTAGSVVRPRRSAPDAAAHALDIESRRHPRHGSRQGQAQRRRAVHCSDRADDRPSNRSRLDQAAALLTAAEDSPLHAYIVLSLLSGPHRGGPGAALVRRRPGR